MQITREDLNPCTVQLKVVCDPEEVKTGYESAFRHLTKQVRLPGFRPGKAPRSMIEPLIGKVEWDESAVEEIVRRSYSKAIEDEKLEVDRTTAPKIVLDSLSKDESKAEYTAKIPLPPKVELGEYKGLQVAQPPVEVTDEELDFEIEELRKRRQTRVAVTDRGVGEGDVAVLNIKLDGDPDEGRNFMTIAGKTFPQLDEAVMGLHVEEMKTVEVTFPENFQEKDWAGKTAQARVTLNSLSAVHLPNLDDDFAQAFQTNNLGELRNRLRERIGLVKQQFVKQMLHEKLLDELMNKSKVAVSDNMWENLAERRVREIAAEQQSDNKSLEDYAKEQGMSLEQFNEEWRNKAKLEVERAVLIENIYRTEGLKVEATDLQEELMRMAQEFGMPADELLEQLSKNKALDELQFRALSSKVGDFLLQNAEVTTA